jgi:hypothetical protein
MEKAGKKGILHSLIKIFYCNINYIDFFPLYHPLLSQRI